MRLIFFLVFFLSFTVGGPLFAQEVPISDAARKQFEIGVKLLQDPDGARYEEAYRAFKRAYADSPSPKILLNLGICAMKLERDSEALWAFRDYLAKVPDIEPDIRSQVETDIETLASGMVPLKLTITPAGASVEDVRIPVRGSRVINFYGPVEGTLDVGIRSGRHELRIMRDGYETEKFEIQAEPGKPIARSIELRRSGAAAPPPSAKADPLPGSEPPSPVDDAPDSAVNIPAFAMVGVTAALAIGTAITGGLALAKAGDFDEVNDGTQVDVAQQTRDDAQTLNIVTDVLLGVTAAAAVVTVVLFVVPLGDDGAPESALVVAPAATGVSLRGAF